MGKGGDRRIARMPGLGNLAVDTVCVGGFFVMVSTDLPTLRRFLEWI